jgi:hypothetical protein
MMAIDCSNMKINVIGQQDFYSSGLQSAQLSRKIKGYDLFCVCAGANVNIIAYLNTKFHLLQTIPNVYTDRIIDVAIYRNYLVPLTQSVDDTLRIIEFDCESYNSLVKKSEYKASRIGLTKTGLK